MANKTAPLPASSAKERAKQITAIGTHHESNLPKNSGSSDDEDAFGSPQFGPKPESEVTIMPQKIMDVLMLGRCSHEFSWPRRGADGDYYQVCLLCAAEYKYDWTTMRRTERVEHAKPETVIRRNHTREKRPSWTPRARRLKLDTALRYRVNSTSTWYEGTIENLSQTGFLFQRSAATAGKCFDRDGV